MPGRFGSDFDETAPLRTELLSDGAREIRDIRTRIKTFINAMFNPETMRFRKGVIQGSALKTLAPNPAGTWREIVVNSRGFVTNGSTPSDLTAPAIINRAWFFVGGGYQDNPQTFQTIADPGYNNYSGSGIYQATYASGSVYYAYPWTVPANVRRVTAFLCGGGGGAASNGAGNRDGGASGEYREANIPVTPGTDISVIVGAGGTGVYESPLVTNASPGGTSAVSTGRSYVEAAGGGGATTAAGGSAQTGAQSSDLRSIVLPGLDGVTSGDYAVDAQHYWYDDLEYPTGQDLFGSSGYGGTDATYVDGHPGFVMLEWVE